MFKDMILRWTIGRLGSKKPGAARKAAAKLAASGDPRAVQPLIDLLLTDGVDEDVHVAAVEALAVLGDERAVEPMVFTLTERDFHLVATEKALRKGSIGVRLSEGTYTKLACAIVTALGQLGDSRAVKPVTSALGFKPEVRQTAAAALEMLGEPEWADVIKGDDGDWKRIAESGNKLAYLPLAAALYKPDAKHLEAVRALRSPRTVDALIAALGSVENSALRKDVASTLYALGESKWAEWVKGEDEDWERLGACDDPRAMRALEKASAELNVREVLTPVGAAALNKLEQMTSQLGRSSPLIANMRREQEQKQAQAQKHRTLINAAINNMQSRMTDAGI